MITLSIILPTYNEKVNIPILVERLERCLGGMSFEIIVVDDNSPDGTWEVAEALATSRPHMHVIRRLHDHGLSSAVMAGFSASRARFMVVMDADLQHDENALPAFLEAFENGADIVVGSRKVAGGKVEDWSIVRKFVSFCAGSMAKLVLTKTVSDPMSGFFGLRKEVCDELGKNINPRGFKIMLEFVARAKGKKIVEVGYTFRGRVHGESKLSTHVMLDYLSALYDLSFGKYVSRLFVKYAVVGFSGVLVNQFVVSAMLNIAGVEKSQALIIGIETSILSNFVLNNFWTFRRFRLKGVSAFFRGLLTFQAVCLGGAFINYAIAMFAVEKMSLNIYWANMIGILMATLWNYLVNASFTWTASKVKD